MYITFVIYIFVYFDENFQFTNYLQNVLDLFKRASPMVARVILSRGNVYKFSENFRTFLVNSHKSRNYEHFVNNKENLLTFLL